MLLETGLPCSLTFLLDKSFWVVRIVWQHFAHFILTRASHISLDDFRRKIKAWFVNLFLMMAFIKLIKFEIEAFRLSEKEVTFCRVRWLLLKLLFLRDFASPWKLDSNKWQLVKICFIEILFGFYSRFNICELDKTHLVLSLEYEDFWNFPEFRKHLFDLLLEDFDFSALKRDYYDLARLLVFLRFGVDYFIPLRKANLDLLFFDVVWVLLGMVKASLRLGLGLKLYKAYLRIP